MYRRAGGLGILRHGQEKEMHTRLDFPHLKHNRHEQIPEAAAGSSRFLSRKWSLAWKQIEKFLEQ